MLEGEFHHQKQVSVLLGGASSLQEDNGMTESIGLNDGEGIWKVHGDSREKENNLPLVWLQEQMV